MDPTDSLVQFGALGILSFLAIYAVKVMYQRMVLAYERELERADRLENELKSLNEAVRTQYIDTLTKATRAIADANDAVANALAAVRRE